MSKSQNEIADILAVERLWTAAHLHGDVATIDHIMVDDYVRIQPDGSLADKAAVLATFLPDRRHWDRAQAARTTCASTATRRLSSDAVSTACIPFVRAVLVPMLVVQFGSTIFDGEHLPCNGIT
jgi:hypothetical protein